jgi:CelD/BcsL family acetyltransferase involved in cellulose biosynthesis
MKRRGSCCSRTSRSGRLGPRTCRTWEDYLAGRSRNFRSQLGRKRRALEREGTVEFRLAGAAGDGLDRDLDEFLRLHEARWSLRGGSESITDRSQRFHRLFAHAADAHGWLRIWLLELDGRAIAAWYGWRIGTKYAYYLAGFDPAWSRYSVGQLLLAHTIESAFEEGAQEYDLLLGDEAYKARYAQTARPVRTVALTRRLSFARASVLAESAARRATDRLPADARQVLKRSLGRITSRLPSRVER